MPAADQNRTLVTLVSSETNSGVIGVSTGVARAIIVAC
jgi:hypothetical protein